jgi:hypothetical protein
MKKKKRSDEDNKENYAFNTRKKEKRTRKK